MRFFTVVTVFTWCTLMTATVTPVRGQDALQTTYVTLTAHKTSLAQAFRQIQQKTGLLFVYQPGLVGEYKEVQVPAGRFTIAQALDSLLTGTYLDFTESNRNIIVFKKPTLLKVRGRVTERGTGDPLETVNVSVKGTDRGTQTDKNGHFELAALNDDVLVFSFTSLLPREIKVNNTTEFDIELEPTQLEAVPINAGYYKVEKKEAVGNISSMTEKDLQGQTIYNPLQGMQGRMAGVYIQQVSGIPGSGYNVAVRGKNSLGDFFNAPLYIIDGVPFPNASYSSAWVSGDILGANASPLATINPNAIESIDVLKDADATAIYGALGANGVVLITTRRVTTAQTQFDMNVYAGFNEVPHRMDLLNSQQYLAMRREAFKNDGASMTVGNARDLLKWDTTRYTDWQKELIGGRAYVTNASFNISGGEGNTHFLLGGTYYREGSVFPKGFDLGYTRGAALFTLNHTSTNKRLRLDLSANYTRDNNKQPARDMTVDAISLAPVAPPIYTDKGDLNWQPGATWGNPYGYLQKSFESDANTLVTRAGVSYRVAKGLWLKTDMGYTYVDTREVSMNPIASQNATLADRVGSTATARPQITTWIAEPQVSYSARWHKAEVTAMAGTTFLRSLKESTTLVADGYKSDALLENLNLAGTITVQEPVYELYKYSAVFGRFNVNWDKRYIINLTARRDASSRFGPDKRFSNFGAVGAGWIFTQESFIGNSLPWLSFGKVRVSAGTSGSDQIGDYMFMDTYRPTDYQFPGQSSIYPVRLLNSQYSWQQTVKLEAGLNVGVCNNRLTVDAALYRHRTSRQLVGQNLPDYTGFSFVVDNQPAVVQNSGLELLVNAIPITRQKLQWSAAINVSFPHSRLVRFDDLENNSTYANSYVVGESLGLTKRLRSTGVNPATGLYTFDDRDDNGVYDASDEQLTRKWGIRCFGGVQNTVTCGAFRLDFLVQFVDQTAFSYIQTWPSIPGGRGANQPTVVLGRWREDGDVTDIQRFTQNASGASPFATYRTASDGVIVDGSFIRLKTASLSYNFNTALLPKLHIEKLRVYVQGQNLLTFTDYIGFDPENASPLALPPLRSVAAGIQVTF
jgi:TonB-linked SusC/RagA family outer membrane protein